MIRLQKIIADAGICSRRRAEEYIEQNRVKVNGHPVSLGDKADPKADIITIDGTRIKQQKEPHIYYILNKPRGYVTTMNDEQNRRCLTELVQDIPARVYPVGRLDVNSEGLLLLTNDGELTNRLTHPSTISSKRNYISNQRKRKKILRYRYPLPLTNLNR